MTTQRKPDARAALAMTAAEMRRRLYRAKLSPGEAAAKLGYSARQIEKMCEDRARIPYLVAYATRHL